MKNSIMMRLPALLATVFFAFHVAAQRQVEGTVTDSLTRKPVTGANITLLRNGKGVAFARSDGNGRFTIKGKTAEKGDRLSVTMMGYGKKVFDVMPDKMPVELPISEQEFVLKEVEVKGGRVVGVRDTISFDLTRFANERDNTLKDVLQKLPGVDISKNGKISYNGKDLSRFTVEGLDLTGGRYNQLTESLKADDVSKAEIIEHDQPIKALQDKIFSDNVAMNIKLKDGARDRWSGTIRPKVLADGTSLRDFRLMGRADVLRIGRKSQSMYYGEYDRSGRDLAANDMLLIMNTDNGLQHLTGIPSWFAMPSLNSPVEEERVRFNTSENFGFKRTAKTKKDNEYRITAGYFRSVTRQQRVNRSRHYLDGALPVELDESSAFRLRESYFRADADFVINNEKVYGNNHFYIKGIADEGVTQFESSRAATVRQRVKAPEVQIGNSFYSIRNRNKWSLTLNSVIDFRHSPRELIVDGRQSRLPTSLFQTYHAMTLLHKYRFLTQSYTIGMGTDNLYLLGKNHTLLKPNAKAYWQYGTESNLWRLSLPVEWHRFTRQNKSFWALSPLLSYTRKPGVRNEWYHYMGYSQTPGWLNLVAIDDHWSDYRTRNISAGIIPLTKTAFAGVNYTYKRPVREIFAKASFSVSRTWLDTRPDMKIEEGNYVLTTLRGKSRFDNIGFGGSIAKGFYELRLKTKLGFNYQYSAGMQSTSAKQVAFDCHTWTATPEAVFSPKWGELVYKGYFTWMKSTNDMTGLPALLNWQQRLSLTKTFGVVDLSVSAVHYRNEQQLSGVKNTLIGDASAVIRIKKWRFGIMMYNLFNQKSYTVTGYSGIIGFTDEYRLRPREFTLSTRFSF